MKTDKIILIIDDDARNIFALTATLKSKGYNCVSAPSAADGLELLQKNKEIGIVLMDIMMPSMDGYEAIFYMREQKQIMDLPIIAVTAKAMTGDKESALAAGANAYISKPIDVDKLLEYLENLLK